ncbi:hypothetical protein ACEPAH_2509 [Sanghuangporus vaninii]
MYSSYKIKASDELTFNVYAPGDTSSSLVLKLICTLTILFVTNPSGPSYPTGNSRGSASGMKYSDCAGRASSCTANPNGLPSPFALSEGETRVITFNREREIGMEIHRLGSSPTLKFAPLFAKQGRGVTPETVLTHPGSSIQVTPERLVFLEAWAASIEIPPSPSTNPLNPSETL